MAVFKEFLESGKITPIVDKTFPLSEAAAAMRYLRDEQPLGKVIITS